MLDRLSKTGWVLLFSCLFLYFVHQLCFVHESQRISNDAAKTGAFLTALFLVLASARNTQFYRQHQQRQEEKLQREKNENRLRLERHEKNQIDDLLRNSLRQALIKEQ